MARHRKLLGEVNLLGLQAFGGDMSPLWGTIIGGGISGVTSVALGRVGGKLASNRELYGFLAGLGSAGVMFAMPSTKKAAFGAVVGAFFGAGLSWLEKMVQPGVVVNSSLPAPAPGAGTAGFGMAKMNFLNGLGTTKVSYLNGLANASISNVPQSVGTIPGVAGAGPSFAGTQLGTRSPVSLLGNPSARSSQVSLLGGPQIHGLSAAYGATLLGGNR